MSDNDPFENLDVSDDPLADLERASQVLTIRTEERRYGKKMVIIDGLDDTDALESLASELKSTLGTGGTAKEGHIEIQGDHADRIREILRDHGYEVSG